MQTHNEKQTIWRRHVAEASRSVDGIASYCRSQGLSAATLHYWKKKFSTGPAARQSSPFVPVEVTRYPRPKVEALPDPRWLAELIKHLCAGGER